MNKERILKRKMLKAWSLDVRERDGNKCQICGSTKFLNAHHILPKEAKIYKFLMFDINNGITLCSKHHKYSYEISPHKNPFIFIIWLVQNRNEQVNYLIPKIGKLELI